MKWLGRVLCIGLCVVAGSTVVWSQDEFAEQSAEKKAEKTPPPEMLAYRINPHPPKIDGLLDDKIWDSHKVDIQRVFTQQEPDEGFAPTESTLVAIAYDDDALYVAFWCYDSEPERIARQLVRRDRWSESDKVRIAVDAFHDHQTASSFEVSAAGVQRDTRYYNDGWSDQSWDAVWGGNTGRTGHVRGPDQCGARLDIQWNGLGYFCSVRRHSITQRACAKSGQLYGTQNQARGVGPVERGRTHYDRQSTGCAVGCHRRCGLEVDYEQQYVDHFRPGHFQSRGRH